MPSNPYPTADSQGYIYDSNQKIEIIFADYIASKYSQSTMFYGQINSIAYDEYSGEYDPLISAEVIKKSLESLYNAYFDQVTIQTTDDGYTDGNVTKIGIQGILVDKGTTYKLNEVLSVDNGRINRLVAFDKRR